MNETRTSGVLFIHSAPSALCSHIEWATAGALDTATKRFEWRPQPAAPGTMRAEFSWRAAVGAGAELAAQLRGWKQLRYEVLEVASATSDGARWSHTPDLGIHYAQVDTLGSVVVPEGRLQAALNAAGSDPIQFRHHMTELLGTAWDEELEVFRQASDGAPIRWLHQVS